MNGLTAGLGPDDWSQPGWHDCCHDTAAAGLLGLPSGTITIGPPPGLHSAVLPTAGARCKFADYPVKRSVNKGVRAAGSLKPAGAAWPSSGTMACAARQPDRATRPRTLGGLSLAGQQDGWQ